MYVVLTDPAIYEFEGEAPPSLETLAAGFRRRESRKTKDGNSVLDWVVRLQTGELTGYVQAVIYPNGAAYIGYEFSSRFWRRGIATAAVTLVLQELSYSYLVPKFVAVLKAANFRSTGLLRKLGFQPGTLEDAVMYDQEDDEVTLVKLADAA
jgi:[ribosomal protein S5]-alanine N-acetyltransferase